MGKKYDIWIDYHYEGWSPEWALDLVELEKTVNYCRQRKQAYIVYDCSGMVVEEMSFES